MDSFVKQTEMLMNELKEFIHSYLVDFDSTYEEMIKLSEDYKALKTSGEELLVKARNDIMPNLPAVSNDHQTLCQKVISLQSMQEVLDHILAFTQAIKELQSEYETLNFHMKCENEIGDETDNNLWLKLPLLDKVTRLDNLVKSAPKDLPLDQINCYNQLNSAKINTCINLGMCLQDVWSRSVVWVNGAHSSDQSVLCSLTFHLKPEQLETLLQIMHMLKLAAFTLQKLGDQIWKLLISPAIENFEHCSIFSSLDSNQCLSVRLVECDISRNFSTPLTVLPKINSTLEMLCSQLFNVNLSNETSVKECIRNCFVDKVIPSIIQYLMSRCLPATVAELDEYEDVANEAIAFEQFCVESGFADVSENRLLSYVSNISKLFEELKEQSLLSKGRALLKENLYATVKIHEASNLASKYFSSSLVLPECEVSQSVVELKNLVDSIMSNTSALNPLFEQTVWIAYNLFSLYLCVVPSFYSDDLENIPQIAALHLNNCNFIAYHCLFFKQKGLLSLITYNLTGLFDGLMILLKREGAVTFLQQFNKQKNVLISECLSSVNKFKESNGQSGIANCDRAARQLIHQIKYLSRVWRVLPEKKYFHTMSKLINFVLLRIINLMLELEDITVPDSVALSEMLNDLRQGLLPIFSPAINSQIDFNKNLESEEDIKLAELGAEKQVKCWPKLKEVYFVLTSSLTAIENRWCSGKGILAYQLSVNELKHLIKALFQQSEQRASFLARLV